MTINMNAHMDSVTRIKPILVRKTRIGSVSYWMLSIPYGDSVMLLYPCSMYTSRHAIDHFCNDKGIDRHAIIVKFEEE